MKLILLITTMFLGACLQTPSASELYLTRKNIPTPTQTSLPHCRGYGCQYIETFSLSDEEWNTVTSALTAEATAPQSAAAERKAISLTIGAFERIMGAKAKTSGDIQGSLTKMGNFQHDCVDESTNTTIYLTILRDQGLLRFHNIEGPNTRSILFLAGRWPHQSAVINDKNTGERFAVDSWFHDNGTPAEIVPLDEWKRGWKPPNGS